MLAISTAPAHRMCLTVMMRSAEQLLTDGLREKLPPVWSKTILRSSRMVSSRGILVGPPADRKGFVGIGNNANGNAGISENIAKHHFYPSRVVGRCDDHDCLGRFWQRDASSARFVHGADSSQWKISGYAYPPRHAGWESSDSRTPPWAGECRTLPACGARAHAPGGSRKRLGHILDENRSAAYIARSGRAGKHDHRVHPRGLIGGVQPLAQKIRAKAVSTKIRRVKAPIPASPAFIHSRDIFLAIPGEALTSRSMA